VFGKDQFGDGKTWLTRNDNHPFFTFGVELCGHSAGQFYAVIVRRSECEDSGLLLPDARAFAALDVGAVDDRDEGSVSFQFDFVAEALEECLAHLEFQQGVGIHSLGDFAGTEAGDADPLSRRVCPRRRGGEKQNQSEQMAHNPSLLWGKPLN